MNHLHFSYPWIVSICKSVAYLVIVPIVGRKFMQEVCVDLARRAPWRERRVIPFLSFEYETSKHAVNRDVRKAVAVARIFGHPLRISYAQLCSEVMRVRSVNFAVIVWSSITTLGSFVAGSICVVYIVSHSPVLSPGYFYSTSKAVALGVCFYLTYRVADRESVRWQWATWDLDCLDECVAILIACGECRRGVGGILDVDRHVTNLCGCLGSFAMDGGGFRSLGKREALSWHLRQVQDDLLKSTDVLLQEGEISLEGVVERAATILDRICEQRWLRLLDLPETTDSDLASTPVAETRGGRDTWVVLGGSLAAAVVLGASGAVGLPLGTAVPAALVLALGPAAVWGSNRLNMSPRGLLHSMSGVLTSAPTNDTTDSQAEPESDARRDSA